MKFIVSYIEREQVTWAGFEAQEDQVLSRAQLQEEKSSGKLTLLEWGVVPRTKGDEVVESNVVASNDEDIEDELAESESSEESQIQNYEQKKPEQYYDTGIGFLSSELTSDTEVDLPFSDRKKAEKIIPLQIQDKLPFDIENVHSSIYQSDIQLSTGYKYFYSALPIQELREIIDLHKTNGIKNCSLHPEVFAATSLHPFLKELLQSSEDSSNKTPESFHSQMILSLKMNSFLLNAIREKSLIHTRAIKISTDEQYRNKQLEAQLGISYQYIVETSSSSSQNSSGITTFIISKPESLLDSFGDVFSEKTNISILDPEDFIAFNESALADVVNGSVFILTLALSAYHAIRLRDEGTPVADLILSRKIYPNFRTGDYKYRAPLTEIKKSFFNELVPFSLLVFFAGLAMLLAVLIPLRQHDLNQKKINELARNALGISVIKEGRELTLLEERIYELETDLGDLSTIQTLSSVEWLKIISTLIPADANLDVDSISISTSGLSLRGTVPDYPSAGRVSSYFESLKSKDPLRFCAVDFKTEDVSIGVSSKQIRVGVSLCE